MNFELDRVRLPLWGILIGVVTVVTFALGYAYYKIDERDAKMLGLVGGILTGFIVYLATFITLLRPIRELDHFQRMGVKRLLANRHEKANYRYLVAGARQRVYVMGASCGRFVKDFMDVDSDDKVLIDALNAHPNLKVRLLIPTDRKMSTSTRSSTQTMLKQLIAVQNLYGNRIELHRFDDAARHSFVLVDNDLVAGPVFDGDKSRHAPAVHVTAGTAFGQKYCAYFDDMWDNHSVSA
jgi:hypothetical protein